MEKIKTEILKKLCYTELVYQRINKKLKLNLSKKQIEDLIFGLIKETNSKFISKIGKNYYIINNQNNIKLTINSNTFRIITVDKIKNQKIKNR